jgi:N-acetylmuramoyl-L-alanine amidase
MSFLFSPRTSPRAASASCASTVLFSLLCLLGSMLLGPAPSTARPPWLSKSAASRAKSQPGAPVSWQKRGRLAQAPENGAGAASGAFGTGRTANAQPDGGRESHDAAESGGTPGQLPPLPIDLSLIRRVRVAGTLLSDAPLRVGNLDILAPIGDHLSGLGASASQAAARNIPGNLNTPTNEQYFQINQSGGVPIVMAVGKSTAYLGQAEQPLRAAPLVMGGKIWLPIYSLAPLIGAACRLDSGGTLHLNPTIQSVELFPVRGQTVLTVKASAPLKQGSVLMGTMDSPPKIYLDFPGFSMGFDASNSTNEKVLTGAEGEVLRVRGGLFQKFPDTTRVVLDLAREATGVTQPLQDSTIFALILRSEGSPQPPVIEVPPKPGPATNFPSGNLRGLTIVVDPGHGGTDIGARGARSKEKDHTLDISLRLQRMLRDRGANVLMTRYSDVTLDLYGRPAFANQRNADLFISVHINSFRSTSAGTETFYWTGHSLAFAREVHREMIKALGLKDRKVQAKRLVVCRLANMPAILTETAFISNPGEEALLLKPEFREKAARAMAQGIQNYADKYMRAAQPG